MCVRPPADRGLPSPPPLLQVHLPSGRGGPHPLEELRSTNRGRTDTVPGRRTAVHQPRATEATVTAPAGSDRRHASAPPRQCGMHTGSLRLYDGCYEMWPCRCLSQTFGPVVGSELPGQGVREGHPFPSPGGGLLRLAGVPTEPAMVPGGNAFLAIPPQHCRIKHQTCHTRIFWRYYDELPQFERDMTPDGSCLEPTAASSLPGHPRA